MPVPSLLGPCECSRPWSLAFRDQDKGGGSTPRRRGRWGENGCASLRDKPGNAQGRARQSGRDFLNATKGPRGGPGAGRRAAEGAGGPPPWAGDGFSQGRPRRGRPPSPREGRALTVQGQEVPARVHARRTAWREGCAAGHSSAATARRPPAPRPPAPPPPGPSNPRLSPPLLGFGWEDRGGGLEARPSLAQACGRVPDRNSQIPLASSAAATHRPRALSLARAAGPHALPVGASPGYSDAPKNLRPPGPGTA